MHGLLWQSWPSITLAESRKVASYFMSQGPLVSFKSTRKHMFGPTGEGIVVFADAEVVNKIMNDQEIHTIDLQHIFAPPPPSPPRPEVDDKSSSSASSDVNTTAEPAAKKSQWLVALKRTNRTAKQHSIERQFTQRVLRSERDQKLFHTYIETVLPRCKGYSKAVAPVAQSIAQSFKDEVIQTEKYRQEYRERLLNRRKSRDETSKHAQSSTQNQTQASAQVAESQTSNTRKHDAFAETTAQSASDETSATPSSDVQEVIESQEADIPQDESDAKQ